MFAVMQHRSLFAAADIDKALQRDLHTDNQDEKRKILTNWKNGIASGKIQSLNERKLQSEFLNKIFGDVLGYAYEKQLTEWQLEHEYKVDFDGKTPDGVLGYFQFDALTRTTQSDVHAIIELKGPLVNLDKKQNRKDFPGTPVEQAFSYVPKLSKPCEWVIVSNCQEIRLYRYSLGMLQYEAFDLLTILEGHGVKRLCMLLQKDQLFLRSTDSAMETMLQKREKELKTITNQFYADYKRHRESLFGQIRRDNTAVPANELFRATQKLIDRLIFMCFARDLSLVENVLKKVTDAAEASFGQDDDKIMQELRRAFVAFDKGYGKRNIPPFNGGLFRGDALLDTLTIRDFRLDDLMRFLNGYNFQGELNVNVLGHIFEQSISDIEEIKAELQKNESVAVGTLEPFAVGTTSKRKKEGVFYTPDYITRYIVEQAVGGWLNDREAEILRDLGVDQLPDLTVADYESIRIPDKGGCEWNNTIALHLHFWEAYEPYLQTIRVLDPACGSGAFLTQVFDFLWEKWRVLKEELYKLTTPYDQQLKALENRSKQSIGLATKPYREWEIKKNIVSRNIYGVDLNPESVEITKLALWLKTASKSETLANLDDHVRQGNSLVSDPAVSEYAFDWDAEFNSVRFDVVVGNPPYVRQELIGSEQKNYLIKNYTTGNGTADLYVYFYDRAISLTRGGGYIGYITPNKFIKAGYGKPLRQYLSQFDLRQIIDFGELPVFADAATFPTIVLVCKQPSTDTPTLFAKIQSLGFASLEAAIQEHPIHIDQNRLKEENWQLSGSEQNAVFDKMRVNSVSLNNYVGGAIQYGIKTGFNEAFVIDLNTRNKLIAEHPASADVIKPFVVGDNVRSYRIDFEEKYIIVIPKGETRYPFVKAAFDEEMATAKASGLKIDNPKKSWNWLEKNLAVPYAAALTSISKKYPSILRHLEQYEKDATNRADKGDFWWELRACDYYDDFEKPKIVFPDITKESRFAFDTRKHYVGDTTFVIPFSDKFLLCVLNSKLAWYFFRDVCAVLGDSDKGGRLRFKKQYVDKLPIANPTPEQQTALAALADRMLTLTEQLQTLTKQVADLFQSDLGVGKLTDKLRHWPALDWPALLAELAKQKVSISLPKQMEWKPFYADQQAKATALQTERTVTNRQIDQLVYALYCLTDAEIVLVEGQSV